MSVYTFPSPTNIPQLTPWAALCAPVQSRSGIQKQPGPAPLGFNRGGLTASAPIGADVSGGRRGMGLGRRAVGSVLGGAGGSADGGCAARGPVVDSDSDSDWLVGRLREQGDVGAGLGLGLRALPHGQWVAHGQRLGGGAWAVSS